VLTIRSGFHVTHMLKDLEAATGIYQRIFQPAIQFAGYHAGEDRDASFVSVSDAYIELFASRDAGTPDPTSTGGRFVKRWGEGLANFGWLIEDVPGAIRRCEAKGYQLVYVAGPDPSAFFVHPRQAHGIMLEIAGGSTGIHDDPRRTSGWATRWRNEHPLGIERMNAVLYAVRDLQGAVSFLQDLSGAPVVHRWVDDDSATERAALWIADHMIEVMQAISDDSEIGKAVQRDGPKIHSVSFKVTSLKRAAAYLREKGVRLLGHEDTGHVTIEPADVMGARYTFTERAIPNDPRDA
jgi:methylmalonyl-CoA/ethylmalonyl-CoA epimerase